MTIRFYDTAMYAPALQPGYLSVASGKTTRAVPGWMDPTFLDFLKPDSPFFHHPIALYSAGHVSNYEKTLPSMLSGRDESNTVVLGDSGGYQIGTGAKDVPSKTELQQIFDWMVKNTDIAMTVDVPGWTVAKEETRWTSARECLEDTLPMLEFLSRANEHVNHPFLNVIQGESLKKAIDWYEAVKHFDFYGWAFAGEIKLNLTMLMPLIARILGDFEERYRKKDLWLHFLGVSDLQTVITLNALQAGLRTRLGHSRIQITFDTSSYYQSGGMYGQYDAKAVFKNGLGNWQMTIPSINFAPLSEYYACDPFPSDFPSSIGARLEMGDLIVNKRDGRGNRFDGTASALIANHNIQAQLGGFGEAVKRLAKPAFIRKSFVAPNLVDACQCVEDLLELPADVKPADYETGIYAAVERQISGPPLSVLMNELSDRKVTKCLAEAKSKASEKHWWEIFNVKKPGRKSK